MNKLVKIIPHNIVKTPKKPQLYKKKKDRTERYIQIYCGVKRTVNFNI